MSDHQQDQQYDERPPEADRQAARDTARDPHEPDFSRLRQARARLDNAFPTE